MKLGLSDEGAVSSPLIAIRNKVVKSTTANKLHLLSLLFILLD
jgi:hypothetical protein